MRLGSQKFKLVFFRDSLPSWTSMVRMAVPVMVTAHGT